MHVDSSSLADLQLALAPPHAAGVAQRAGAVRAAPPLRRDVGAAVVARHAPRPPPVTWAAPEDVSPAVRRLEATPHFRSDWVWVSVGFHIIILVCIT